MAELKPLGSEKLNSDDKLKRILELTYFNNNKKNSTSKADLVKESTNGGVYGIVKEKDGYYVKRGLNESSLSSSSSASGSLSPLPGSLSGVLSPQPEISSEPDFAILFEYSTAFVNGL